MRFEIDLHAEEPIYQQLQKQIILGLAKGELAIGEQLPSVRQLADELGVNMMTISKAYNALKTDGYLVTNRRNGTVVSQPAAFSTSQEKNYQQAILQLLADAYLHGKEKQAILGEIAEQLQLFSEGGPKK